MSVYLKSLKIYFNQIFQRQKEKYFDTSNINLCSEYQNFIVTGSNFFFKLKKNQEIPTGLVKMGFTIVWLKGMIHMLQEENSPFGLLEIYMEVVPPKLQQHLSSAWQYGFVNLPEPKAHSVSWKRVLTRSSWVCLGKMEMERGWEFLVTSGVPV